MRTDILESVSRVAALMSVDQKVFKQYQKISILQSHELYGSQHIYTKQCAQVNVIVIVTLAVRKLSVQSSHGACLKTKELSWIWRCQYWLSALSAEQCSVYWSNKYIRIVQASLACRLCCLQSQVGLKAVQKIAFNLLLSFSPNVERSAFQLSSSDPYVSVPSSAQTPRESGSTSAIRQQELTFGWQCVLKKEETCCQHMIFHAGKEVRQVGYDASQQPCCIIASRNLYYLRSCRQYFDIDIQSFEEGRKRQSNSRRLDVSATRLQALLLSRAVSQVVRNARAWKIMNTAPGYIFWSSAGSVKFIVLLSRRVHSAK